MRGSQSARPRHHHAASGDEVRLLDRRPIVERDGSQVRTWIAIAPPPGDVRFVRASALSDGPEAEPPPRSRLAAKRDEPRLPSPTAVEVAPEFLAVGPSRPEDGLSADSAAAIRTIEAAHRAELRKPMEHWNLEPIEKRYAELVKAGLSADDRRAVEDRLQRVRRQRSAADAAARLAAIVDRSRARDADGKAKSDPSRAPGQRGYDATGLLQSSSRYVDGRKVYVLLGDDGGVVAYLAIPPGLPVRSLLTHRVGVRGAGGFDENLRTRLFRVDDLEVLDDQERATDRPARSPVEP